MEAKTRHGRTHRSRIVSNCIFTGVKPTRETPPEVQQLEGWKAPRRLHIRLRDTITNYEGVAKNDEGNAARDAGQVTASSALLRTGRSTSTRLLQRLWFGFVLRRLFVQQGDQVMRRGRGFYLAAADNVLCAELLLVQLFVGTSVRAQRGALQRNAGEQPLGSRVGQNLSASSRRRWPPQPCVLLDPQPRMRPRPASLCWSAATRLLWDSSPAARNRSPGRPVGTQC